MYWIYLRAWLKGYVAVLPRSHSRPSPLSLEGGLSLWDAQVRQQGPLHPPLSGSTPERSTLFC